MLSSKLMEIGSYYKIMEYVAIGVGTLFGAASVGSIYVYRRWNKILDDPFDAINSELEEELNRTSKEHLDNKVN